MHLYQHYKFSFISEVFPPLLKIMITTMMKSIETLKKLQSKKHYVNIYFKHDYA